MNVNTDALRWFQQVAEGTTVTEVSDLGVVTQSGASRALRRLEAEAPVMPTQRDADMPNSASRNTQHHNGGSTPSDSGLEYLRRRLSRIPPRKSDVRRPWSCTRVPAHPRRAHRPARPVQSRPARQRAGLSDPVVDATGHTWPPMDTGDGMASAVLGGATTRGCTSRRARY